MKLRRTGLLLALAIAVLCIGIDASGANDIAQVASATWWSKRPAAMPTTGATSFEVASGVDGDESVAGLRVLVHGTVTKATLTISEAANQPTAISAPKLQVCTTSGAVMAGPNPGAYTDAPKADCDKGASALARDDKGNWSADVTSWLTGAINEVHLMVVPAPDKTLPVPPTFFVQFATSRITAEGTPDVTTPVAASAPPKGPPAGKTTVTAAPSRSTASAPVSTPATVPTPTPTSVAATPTPQRLGGIPVSSTTKKKQWGKLVWVLPLSALIAFGWVLGRKSLLERGLLASS
jgi:hypothetical protein